MRRRHFIAGMAGAALPPVLGPAFQPARSASRSARPALSVNGQRLNAALARFDAIGRTPGGINRVAYTDADLEGRAFTQRLFRDAGLAPRIDAAGNILGRVEGSEASLPPILIGSHVDSVTDGGNYDGPVGSFAAIEVARTLLEAKRTLRHPLEVIVFQNEEGGTIGSKLLVGDLTEKDLGRVARSGKTLREGLELVGGRVDALAGAVRAAGDVACYLELHIEQGGRLEQAGLAIGVVEGIVGLRWLEVTIDGFANHAGTTPMDQRQDAMLAAARYTVAVNERIRREPGRQVATIGRVVPEPNTTNVIPGRVVLTVDLRELSADKLVRLAAELERIGHEVGRDTGTRFAFRPMLSSEPALAHPAVMRHIAAAAEGRELGTQQMPSGAGHDAQEIARIAPMGMIFVPSVGGISHSPKELTHPADIVNGANVLLDSVIALDRRGVS